MPSDVVDLIMADHREVERLFDMLQKEPAKRPLVLPTVTALIIAHARAEETEVYPAARKEAGETDEVAHSQEEHAEAETILARLAEMAPDDSAYESTLQELIDAVKHHVEEEESSVLPGMRERLDDQRRHELAEAFVASRTEHLGDRPGEASKAELLQQAANAGVEGRTSMTREELKEKLQG